jgi:hypothetical protein
MWQDSAAAQGAGDNPNSPDEPAPGGEILQMVRGLNVLCLELLAEEARQQVVSAPPMFRELADLWRRLDGAALERAAGCPYLLLDAGFCDPYRWRWLADQLPAVQSAPRIGDREPAPYNTFFTVRGAIKVAHQVFVHAWHIARAEPTGSSLLLGMPEYCASSLRACSLQKVIELADQHAGWLRPRWPGRPRMWRELLQASLSQEPGELELARLHGVQLLAIELKALERVKGHKTQ